MHLRKKKERKKMLKKIREGNKWMHRTAIDMAEFN